MGREDEKENNMPENGEEILEAVLEIQKITSQTRKDVAVIKQKVETIEIIVGKHEKILYGNPEKMGEGGIIYTVQNQENKLGNIKRDLTLLVSAIGTFVTFAFNIVISWVKYQFWGK